MNIVKHTVQLLTVLFCNEFFAFESTAGYRFFLEIYSRLVVGQCRFCWYVLPSFTMDRPKNTL